MKKTHLSLVRESHGQHGTIAYRDVARMAERHYRQPEVLDNPPDPHPFVRGLFVGVLLSAVLWLVILWGAM